MPCSDIKNECNTASKKEQHSSHQHNQDKDDNCTPFCSCTCCVSGISASFPKHSVTTNLITHQSIGNIPNYNSQFISHFYGNLWQPPKI